MPDRRAFLTAAVALPVLTAAPRPLSEDKVRADTLPPEWEKLAWGATQWVPAAQEWEARAAALRAFKAGFALADFEGSYCGTATRYAPVSLVFRDHPLAPATVRHDTVWRYRSFV